MDSISPPLRHAWITTPEGTYSAASRRSAVFELIEGIYAGEAMREKSRARSILRHRIYTDHEPTYSERETVKVAAKRIERSEEAPPSPSLSLPTPARTDFGHFEWKGRPLTAGTLVEDEEIRPLLDALLAPSRVPRERWSSDRPVSAILLDDRGKLVSFAWNTHAKIRTRHAEWNLCERLIAEGARIPPASRLYVSLKPCRMCAARIWECAEDPVRLAVRYLENDPGPLAQETLLDTASLARRRYFGPRDPRFGIAIQDPFPTSP